MVLLAAMTHLVGMAWAQSERTQVEASNLADLQAYAEQSGLEITMEPGLYRLIDWLPLDSMTARRESKRFEFMNLSGSGNVFRLRGVTIEVDTALRSELRPPTHTSEFLVTGNGNVVEGLTITDIGEGLSRGGSVVSVGGDGNTLRDITLHVRGSSPYGYGDLFGKSGGYKHSGLLVVGNDAHIVGCKLYMGSFGHGYYIQKEAENARFENCYVEGVMRSTDEMLAETSGFGFDRNFESVYKNRDGEARVTPGYMKSLAEDGYRTYGDIKNISFTNCVAKHMRGGFELRTDGGARVEDCRTIGTERGYWVAGNAVVVNSVGDAQYGPLLFVEGANASVELSLTSAESELTVHSLATIHGSGHQVTIRRFNGESRSKVLPILIGYAQPGAGEGISPYSERATRGVTLRNETSMPIIVGQEARDGVIQSAGPTVENKGRSVSIEPL
ncbi:hypothetical protein HN371_11640 [Candidatus Poribacteria bacterium]|jgi:hypothetical protein|nr:hypothetical protein [Candidatus Poribacteria bacterium]MBT5712332.1 hypothetical protein [Candidatus Poribacteria bacterium]MBT7097791.1 hypothetical protein [Candidatus Poribacteria bacterium]MBT7805006.1 hypothetical protein [Candidatus Poribacteria bacterium]